MSLAANALCTLADLETYLGLTSGTYDAALESLIDAVSARCEKLTGRRLAAADLGHREHGNGRSELWLPEYPVNSIASVLVSGVAIPEAADPAEGGAPSGWLIADASAGRLVLLGYTFTRGISNVLISYNAGLNPVPADLKQAAVEWAAWCLKESGIKDIGDNKLGETGVVLPGDGGNVSYWMSGLEKSVPPQVKAILERYTRRGCA